MALDWKWLFIYPDQKVASLNELVVPEATPVHLQITSASVMNTFWVPQLAGMIYAMNGMVTQLNLAADHEGAFTGRSGDFSGDNFSDMHFVVRSVTKDAFARFVSSAQSNRPHARPRRLRTTRAAERRRPRQHLPRRRPGPVPCHCDPADPTCAWPDRAQPGRSRRSSHDCGEVDARQAHLVGHPTRPAHPAGRRRHRRPRARRRRDLGPGQGLRAVSLARVDHVGRSQADRRGCISSSACWPSCAALSTPS